MTPDNKQAPRFEPPPWEAEAFERFRQEQERLRAAEELEQSLRQVMETPLDPAAEGERPVEESRAPSAVPAVAPEAAPTRQAEDAAPATPGTASMSEAQIEAMLTELKSQEAPNPEASQTLVYGSVAFLGTLGVFMAIFAIAMFTRANPSSGPAMMLAAITSLIMLVAGGGCIAGAVVLYRKHHQ